MTRDEALRERAARFHQLHVGPAPFVLPNAWDAASARVLERAGFTAIATSGGMAFALGYPDGEWVDRDTVIDVHRRIAAAVHVPVSADLEAGYGRTPDAVADTARAAIEAGVVGMILQDWAPRERRLCPIAEQVARIQAIRAVARSYGLPFVINARTEVFLEALGDPTHRLDVAVERLRAYRAAGADCLFVPGVRDADTIARLVGAIDGPLNVIAGPGAPPVAELARLGVKRISFGSSLMRGTLGVLGRMTEELRTQGADASLVDALPYTEVNGLFAGRHAA
jgi:2-methylisocitrate lyase-like PEP mutase family enzyme